MHKLNFSTDFSFLVIFKIKHSCDHHWGYNMLMIVDKHIYGCKFRGDHSCAATFKLSWFENMHVFHDFWAINNFLCMHKEGQNNNNNKCL